MALALCYYTGYKLEDKKFRGAGFKIYYNVNRRKKNKDT